VIVLRSQGKYEQAEEMLQLHSSGARRCWVKSILSLEEMVTPKLSAICVHRLAPSILYRMMELVETLAATRHARIHG
jgi:hypothetical protein